MENLDVLVLKRLLEWRMLGHRALLATVARTWGSSPRPEGSIMAVREDGAVVGSVSGGCIEDDVVHRYCREKEQTTTLRHGCSPRLLKYGIGADEAHRFGLPCGGTLEVLLEFDPDASALDELLALLEQGHLVSRSVRLTDGHVTLASAASTDQLEVDEHTLKNIFGPEYRMLLIGAGQLAEYVATMAAFSGFDVTVCDPREEYRGSWSVAAAKLTSDMPDEVVAMMKPDRRTCIIALTHDPKLDDLALLEALDSDAFYVGAIGSRRNNMVRRERLIEHFNHSEESLRRLRGPIGLFIGSKVPAEIAISVMAEVIAAKNGVIVPAQFMVGPAKERRTGIASGGPLAAKDL
jgi:xanthine dehydrogenase accessory factor